MLKEVELERGKEMIGEISVRFAGDIDCVMLVPESRRNMPVAMGSGQYERYTDTVLVGREEVDVCEGVIKMGEPAVATKVPLPV